MLVNVGEPGKVLLQGVVLTPDQVIHGEVLIDGDTIAIGAPLNNAMGSAAGAVYVFERVGLEWQSQPRITASDSLPNTWFGLSVSLSGASLAISVHTPSTLSNTYAAPALSAAPS